MSEPITEIRQSIETAWSTLLDTVWDAATTARQSGQAGASEIAIRLESLHSAIRGLGWSWKEIAERLPVETIEEADRSDVAGALPESAYWKPLARALHAAGGQLLTHEAISAVGQMLANQLTSVDREPLRSGEVRWTNRIRFARNRLKIHGLISQTAPAGIWQLTDAGRRWALSDSRQLPAPIKEPDPNQLSLPF